MTAAATWEVGPNVLAIVVLLVGALNAYLSHRTTKVAVETNKTVATEFKSNDGSTLRDATDRMESALGTIKPKLPKDQQVYDASQQKEPHE